MKVTTYADVKAEIARANVRQGDVARRMGYDAGTFSHILADRAGKPSATWIARFEDALEVEANGVPTERPA